MGIEDMEKEAKAAAYEAMFASGQTGLVTSEPSGQRHCHHYRAKVDKHERTLICRDCECRLDPYHWMEGRADEWAVWVQSISVKRKEMYKLKVEIVEKTKELRSLDAKLARRKAALKKLNSKT